MKKEKIKKLGKYFGGIIAGGVLILAMTLLITVPISADDPNDATAQPPQGVEPEQPTYNEVKEVIHNPPVWRTYKDFNAWWGENRDHATLLTIGKVQGSDYFIHPMSALQTGIPSGTAVVLMTSNSYGWASTRNAQKDSTAQANLTSFLQGGGVVIVDMGDNDYYDGYLAPGAVGTPSYILETCQDATLDLAAVATNHPIIIGPDGIPGTADDLNNSNVDMAYSCYVAHGNLVDGITLPPDAKVIMTSTFGGVEKPILAEYCYQGGRVIVDTVTKEFVAHQPPGYGYTNVMKNLFSYALSPEAKCAPVNQPPTISNLGQFKSDGILPIDEISITTESTVVFKATLNDLENDKVKLQIELKEKDQPFNGQGLLESDFASSGNEVSIARYGLINDKYHWRARAVDEKRTASDWQEFGQIGNIDFEVKLVPLYTQVRSPYPSDNETKIWAVLPYAEGPAGNYDCGSTIAQCGCALTSGVMVLRYYDITTVNYEDVNPRTTNEWLKNNKGYFAGDVNWLKVAEYSDYRIKYDTAKSGNYVNNYTLLDKHLNKNQPVIAKEINPGHFIVIDNKLATTYGVKDPSWYNTKKLDEPTTDWASKIRDYNNNFYGLRLYYPGDGIAMKAISLSLASPAEILITDPLGRKLGKDPISDAEYNEIPDGSYFTENIDDPTGELPPS
ncbi:C39 family peptidase, partial [Candidatus Parcubacteria bacterium]|nr:C39 family peptidase [Candidatus Parcubacteria bacterium]